MKRLALLVFLALPACDGGGTNSPTVTAVTISPGAATVGVGSTVQLSANATLSDGSSTAAGISWNSLDGAIATVSGTGLVTGVAAGVARITATLGNKADTVQVTVSAPAVSCNAGNSLTLAVGQATILPNTQATAICVPGGAAGAEYTIIPQFASSTSSGSVQLGVQVSGNTIGVAGPPNPSRVPGTLHSAIFAGGPVADEQFHIGLRERTALAMVDRVAPAQRWNRERSTVRRNVLTVPPAVGTLLPLNVSQSFCNSPDIRTGRVAVVSTRAVIVEDTANPKPGLTAAQFEHIAATFDTLVYPLAVATFGAPGDLDANERVVIFYTRAVNELTPAGSNGYVGGFFYGRDLFPKVASGNFPENCPGSNQAEMFYMLVPDAAGAVNGNVRSINLVMQSTVATIGHEFQHLISASRRLYIHNAPGTSWSEDTFLNEGLSHITEELLYYRASGLAPRSNLDYDDLFTTPQRENAFLQYMNQNFSRFRLYLQSVEQNGVYDDDDDLETRGGIWAFLRYAADRRNGDDQQLWFQLVNNTSTGLANLNARLGVSTPQWVRDFEVAVYADDAVPGVAPEFQNLSWNFRSIYSNLLSSHLYPLMVRYPTAGTNTNITLAAGAASYLRLGVPSGAFAGTSITSGGGAPPATVTVTVLRTK
jgi:hypothetical protein